MLGRLRMDVDTCINKYVELSSAAFQPKRSKANIFGKAKDLWKTDGAYRSDCLATEFKKLAQALECDEQSKLIHPDTTCRVFVCAFTKALNTPVRLRSYITEDSVDTLAGSGCSIWEAARATSAAAVFFDPIEVGRQKYVDGATGFNNPVEVVLEEAVSIWPDAVSRIQCLVSIGTGASELRDFGDNLKEVINTLKAISTETEETEKRFFKNHKHLGVGDRYFRFNVDKGLGGVGLDEHQKVDKVEAATEAYLEGLRVKQAVEAFIAARAPQNSPVKADVKESYLRWLEYIDPLKSHNDARQYRTTNSTGEWFLRGEFERWKIQPRSFLWLCAKAGSGKTVLSSAIIDEIEQQHLGALAYFYFSFQSKERQDVRHFKYSILIQIVRSLARQDPQRPDHFYVPRAFRELYEGYQPSRDPKTEDLDATFLGVLNESKETYFVVDALDECPSSTDRKAVITFLAELSHNSRSRTHILITSRREEDIEITISEMPNEKSVVPFEIIKINADIRNHLQDRMEKEPYRRWSDALKSKVVNHLTELADGVFRWVDLQIRDLGGKAREKDVDRALKRLPKTLGETYQRILERIDEENYTEEAVVILRWLAYGHRPLLLSEAAEIAAFEITKAQPLSRPDDYSLSFTPDNRFPSPSWVRRILSGLVTVSGIEDRSSFPDEEVSSNLDGTISFAHFSVKEYLESAGVSPPHFHLEDKSCQWFILKSCFAYIHYYDTTTPEPSDSDPFPLLLYSCKWLWRHAMTLWGDPDQSITRSAIKALTAPLNELHGTAFALSIKAALDLKKEQTYIEMVPTFKEDRANKVSPSLFSDCLGKFDNEGNFVELGFDLESPSALHSASAMGEVDLVKLMLNAGVDVNPERVYRGPKQGDYGTVFNWTPKRAGGDGSATA
ncbi:hypothetical protein K469DRAFT_81105 [Zopfia rhizophila CBS 207.26]|uniref:NACHT domain-containing protein n=1 Tax=Zopfia rhizophila CBS 207.26 TaxID=1314779 RepID=A0A6A6D6J9_9PEZI|nr:hypothetical protein K469DRAFT_81105 [Zopfia rhizophila CBS 207.26]